MAMRHLSSHSARRVVDGRVPIRKPSTPSNHCLLFLSRASDGATFLVRLSHTSISFLSSGPLFSPTSMSLSPSSKGMNLKSPSVSPSSILTSSYATCVCADPITRPHERPGCLVDVKNWRSSDKYVRRYIGCEGVRTTEEWPDPCWRR